MGKQKAQRRQQAQAAGEGQQQQQQQQQVTVARQQQAGAASGSSSAAAAPASATLADGVAQLRLGGAAPKAAPAYDPNKLKKIKVNNRELHLVCLQVPLHARAFTCV